MCISETVVLDLAHLKVHLSCLGTCFFNVTPPPKKSPKYLADWHVTTFKSENTGFDGKNCKMAQL